MVFCGLGIVSHCAVCHIMCAPLQQRGLQATKKLGQDIFPNVTNCVTAKTLGDEMSQNVKLCAHTTVTGHMA
eukprot:4231114-Amphidinium_carterae.1